MRNGCKKITIFIQIFYFLLFEASEVEQSCKFLSFLRRNFPPVKKTLKGIMLFFLVFIKNERFIGRKFLSFY